MVDDMDPSTERRCPINGNNENAKVINIDVSDVIKLLKYMHAETSRFFKPNNIHEKFSRFWLKHSASKNNNAKNNNVSVIKYHALFLSHVVSTGRNFVRAGE